PDEMVSRSSWSARDRGPCVPISSSHRTYRPTRSSSRGSRRRKRSVALGASAQGVSTIWLGIDDTDSPEGGCTTWVLTELLALAREEDVDLIGEPHLVRLNPNIPWKTRGNAALAARFGRGRGPRRRLGEVSGRPVWSFAEGGPLSAVRESIFVDRAWERVRASSRLGEPRTDPALVAVRRRLPAWVYYRAVREVVPVEEARRYLESVGALVYAEGDGRGVVGASAAIAWPARRVTWELIAYRPVAREGARR